MNQNATLPLFLRRHQVANGFTLVEVLVVIAIISILMAAGVAGIGKINDGKAVTSAVATCESLFEQARSLAISKNCHVRVLIDFDNSTGNQENYLRRVIVVHEEIDNQGNLVVDSWEQPNRAYIMPKGAFFSQNYSQTAASNATFFLSGAKIKPEFSRNYLYYEFNGAGIISNPGASFIIGSGIRPKNAEKPKTTASASRDFSGFVIWRNGSTCTYRSPDQIPTLPSTGTFEF